MNNVNKGIYLALGTALISGVSVFVSKFAVRAVSDPYLFTTAKNIVVALALSLLILTPLALSKLRQIKRQDWPRLIAIGIIGGSIPFLLFFQGLSLGSAINTAFIHKTLFVWVAILAIPFLKEKISRMHLFALGLLLVGNIFLGGLDFSALGRAELLVFIATLLWAVEYVIAKKTLANLDPLIVAWARMFFGAIVLVGFVVFRGQGSALVSLNLGQLAWIGITSAFLLGYVLTWYRALKFLPATVVTCILVIASPITTCLNTIFVQHKYSMDQVMGSLILVSAVGLISWVAVQAGKEEVKTLIYEKNQ